MSNSNKYLIVVCGPTASGKTRVAIRLAQHFKTDILSTDSRQLFKELNIGTAKPDTDELSSAKHHFIDHVSISEEYNAGRFEEESIALLEQLHLEKEVVIAAGGTGLYINALVNGLDDIPHAGKEVREALVQEFHSFGLTHLQKLAAEADPESYASTDISNHIRLIRIIEVFRATGTPISEFRKNKNKERSFKVIKIGLETERELLYKKINERVNEMMDTGLLDEVKRLLPYRNRNGLQTVGYQELFDYLEAKVSLKKAVELIKRNSRRYAKRQMTWFRRDKDIQWFRPNDTDSMIAHIESSLEGSLVKSSSN